jgi:hypothetical protein
VVRISTPLIAESLSLLNTGSAAQSNSNSKSASTGTNAWVQSAIAVAKGNSSSEGATSNPPGSGSAQTAALPLTVSTATFPGIPAVRLIGDRQFLHRLCQLLFFCLVFRKRQLPRFAPRTQADSTSAVKGVGGVGNVGSVDPKIEDAGTTTGVTKSSSLPSSVKAEDGTRAPAGSKTEEVTNSRSQRVGNGNAGQGYTSEEVQSCPNFLLQYCRQRVFQASFLMARIVQQSAMQFLM